jgi:hypothetical protein
MASERLTPAREGEQTGSDPAGGPAQGSSRRAGVGRILGAIVIVVAIVAAVAFAVTAGVPDGDVVAHVAAAQDLAPTRPAPASGEQLAGLRTPNLAAYGWAPQGARVDVIGTHTVATTYFQRGGRLLAVSSVSGGPIREPGPAVVTPDGVSVHRMSLAGRTILSWRRGGHTFVLSSIAVPVSRLLDLARALNAPRAAGAAPAHT